MSVKNSILDLRVGGGDNLESWHTSRPQTAAAVAIDAAAAAAARRMA